jgi:ribosomal protein S18 acetylase RimI-like enzyme
MRTRWYTEDDDPALMHLERQCPRGEPSPFVHYRRRFVDRAAIFKEYCLLLVEEDSEIIACAAAAIKDTHIKRQPVRLAYIFDVRVAPKMRRQGLAFTLLTHLEQELLTTFQCDGAYAHIVATNQPSIRLFDALGYHRRRQLRLLSYLPYPLIDHPPLPHSRSTSPRGDVFSARYGQHDVWVNDAACSLQPYGFEEWLHEGTGGRNAAICLYRQSQLFQQIPADVPWPSANEMARRGQHWRLFHPFGDTKTLEHLFATVRDTAVSANINRLSLLADAEDPIPTFFYAEAQGQREYVVMSNSYSHRWDGTFGKYFYCDTREL